MANSKVSDLTAASALDGTELYYGVQSSADRKVTGAQIRTLVGGVSTAAITISSAELLAIFTSPKVIVAAPGAGFAIQVLDYIFEYKFNTVAYTINNDIILNYTGDTTKAIDNYLLSTFLTSTQSVFGPGSGSEKAATATFPLTYNRTTVENKAVQVTGLVGNPTLGDGVLYVTLRYRIYTFQG